MKERLRFAEAVCAGHPDRLADTIADRIVALAIARDPEALVGVEVALHRNVVFIDGRIAAGRGNEAAVGEEEIVSIARQAFADAGYGKTPSGYFPPDPASLAVRTDLCLGPLREDERAIRDVSDDQAICVGHAVWGPRAGHRPLEQALATDLAAALERLRVERADLGLGPDGKCLVTVRGRALLGVSLSIHHAPGIDWVALTRKARAACEAVAKEYVEAGELDALRPNVDWLINGAGAFDVGGPEGDNGLSGKKLVAQAYGSAVPIGGGATSGKDPRKVDPRGQALARSLALEAVVSGHAREATVWLAYRPGDLTPRWVEVVSVPKAEVPEGHAVKPPSRPSRRHETHGNQAPKGV
jgi:S-adenosylmethionine synthetase